MVVDGGQVRFDGGETMANAGRRWWIMAISS